MVARPKKAPAVKPAPFIPADCDLRDLPAIMLQRSIATSHLGMMSTGEEFKAAILLYEAAYDQQPAGSLPAEDIALAFLSRAGSKWPKVRGMALRGWVQCSDGRLYHAITAEKVLVAWISRLNQRRRSKAGGAAKNNKNMTDGDVLLSQIHKAFLCLERVAPGCREVSKWQASRAQGTGKGTASGTAEAPPQAMLDKCQGEAEGEGKGKEVRVLANSADVYHLGATRGATA